MNDRLQPFPLTELFGPAFIILVFGFLIALWITRKPHWSLFVAGVKASIFFVYYGAYFDGTFTFLDDWTYMEVGLHLHETGVSFTNFLGHLPELISTADGTHFIYYLYNADSFRLLGTAYYAPVTLNIVLTFVAAGFIAAVARSSLKFSRAMAVGLFVFLALHPNVLAWSTIMNGKDTLVLAGTAMAIYAVSLVNHGRYVAAVLLTAALGSVLFFTRFYVPVMLMGALFAAVLLSPRFRSRPMVWVLVLAGLVGVVSFLGDGVADAFDWLQAGFVNPLYGIPRMLLTPIPFNTTEDYAFLNLPQVFHWMMMPALVYGVYRIWRLGSLTARFIVLYFLLMILLYGMFDTLQGPRHRYQIDGVIALFQFYGALGILKQLLPLRRAPGIPLTAGSRL